MDAVFYDRKNKLEVTSSELMEINFVEVGLFIDSEEFRTGEWQGPAKHPAYLKEKKLGTLGYKSKDCPKNCNWDMSMMESDLVFLRLDPSPK